MLKWDLLLKKLIYRQQQWQKVNILRAKTSSLVQLLDVARCFDSRHLQTEGESSITTRLYAFIVTQQKVLVIYVLRRWTSFA